MAGKEAKIHFDHFHLETLLSPLPPVSHCCVLQLNMGMLPLWGFLEN